MNVVQKNTKGFTLIELVIVILILGIISITAIPSFVNLAAKAKENGGKAGLGALRSVIAIGYANSALTDSVPTFPSAITTTSFADGRIPENPMNNNTAVLAVTGTQPGTASSGTSGWWYYSASGLVGAFSHDDNSVDTSTW